MTEIPANLPECELLRILFEKADQKIDTSFDFYGRFKDFRDRVSQEIRYINLLFPEYTPHDEEYHIKSIFHVADTLLGRGKMEVMNASELFVLAISLYGHDWGMAVSNAEKHFIVTGHPLEGTNEKDFWILDNERSHFVTYANAQGFTDIERTAVEDIPVALWRDYIRETHSLRSGVRVKRFFERNDLGVAEAASRVCVGHGLNFEEIEDHDSYPPDFSVLREAINLRALTIYVRLIDLLDLSDERTPYVIWKFVAPRDPRSQMEWAKHRALQPVTCPAYQDGRIIRIDGGTTNHEVYAAIQDLKRYCEEQFRRCNDTLARMNDLRHKLDLYHMEWRIAAQGFEPISIQFEFDRVRMFEILSDEIYQGDSYVFLRELLQNSIDAIRMRQSVLRREGLEPKELGVIYVDVEHREKGDAVVTWRDDGIGMDEYIIRNYLSVAGKSYYQSADFQKQGLNIDPISRFGVGILSCFMVAERIEIETYKESHFHPAGEPLRIMIPAVRRQFRIEKCPGRTLKTGTTVKVFVQGKKLLIHKDTLSLALDVTKYLSIVAGFVEFPIVITEGDKKTVILHPHHDAGSVRDRFADYKIHQCYLKYPWPDVFWPQDIAIAQEFLKEENYDIKKDLGLTDHEGLLSFVVPLDNVDIRRNRYGGDYSEVDIISRGVRKRDNRKLRWHNSFHMDRTLKEQEAALSKSSSCSPFCVVYRDGILLSSVKIPSDDNYEYFERVTPKSKLIVNLPKSKPSRLDLARTKLLDTREKWNLPIDNALLEKVFKPEVETFSSLASLECLYRLGRIVAFYGISKDQIWQISAHDYWPLLFLNSDGSFGALPWKDIGRKSIFLVPNVLSYPMMEVFCAYYDSERKRASSLPGWEGEACFYYEEYDSMHESAIVGSMATLSSLAINKFYHLDSVRFLNDPRSKMPPIHQMKFAPDGVPDDYLEIDSLMKKIVTDPAHITSFECQIFRKELKKQLRVRISIAAFSAPFEKYLAYGWHLLNQNHPFVHYLMHVAAVILLASKSEIHDKEYVGRLQDSLRLLPFFGDAGDLSFEELYILLERLRTLMISISPGNLSTLAVPNPTFDDFVPGSLKLCAKTARVRAISDNQRSFNLEELSKRRPFGRIIEKLPFAAAPAISRKKKK